MLSRDLVAVLRIKTMAEQAFSADSTFPSSAEAVAQAYIRLREEARRVNERAGWSTEDFDREIPDEQFIKGGVAAGSIAGRYTTDDSYHWVSVAAPRAKVLLAQLAAWADGHVQAFQIEAQLKADAEARAAKASKGRVGF